MSNLAYERLHANLVKLKLNTVGTILDNYLEIAAKFPMYEMKERLLWKFSII